MNWEKAVQQAQKRLLHEKPDANIRYAGVVKVKRWGEDVFKDVDNNKRYIHKVLANKKQYHLKYAFRGRSGSFLWDWITRGFPNRTLAREAYYPYTRVDKAVMIISDGCIYLEFYYPSLLDTFMYIGLMNIFGLIALWVIAMSISYSLGGPDDGTLPSGMMIGIGLGWLAFSLFIVRLIQSYSTYKDSFPIGWQYDRTKDVFEKIEETRGVHISPLDEEARTIVESVMADKEA